MSSRNKFVMASIIVLISVSSIVAIGSNGKYKEPSKRPDLPKSAVFNEYLNEYYDSEIYQWNAERMDYDYIVQSSFAVNSEESNPKDAVVLMYSKDILVKGEDGKYLEPDISMLFNSRNFKWNPLDGSHYDPNVIEWDVKFGKYVDVNSNYNTKKPEQKSMKHFELEYKDSKDEVKLALIEYINDYENYVAENYKKVMLSSAWNVGPLDAIHQLGLEKLPELLNYVEEDNVFCVPVMIAIIEMIKCEEFAPFYPNKEGIKVWKEKLIEKLSSNDAAEIVKEVKSKGNDIGRTNKLAIEEKFNNLGAFALPVFYDEIINKSSDDLLEYAICVLPKKTIEKYKIDKNSSKETIIAAVKSCREAVKVLNKHKGNGTFTHVWLGTIR